MDGENEIVSFTRGDADRMTRLEKDVDQIKRMVARITYIVIAIGIGLSVAAGNVLISGKL